MPPLQLKHYKAAWKKEQERLYIAFLHKHDIFPPSDENAPDREYSQEEIDEYKKMKALMRNMSEQTFFKPAGFIGAGGAA